MNNVSNIVESGIERPWWFVRFGLLATLVTLLALLVTLLSKPELIDRGIFVAGV